MDPEFLLRPLADTLSTRSQGSGRDCQQPDTQQNRTNNGMHRSDQARLQIRGKASNPSNYCTDREAAAQRLGGRDGDFFLFFIFLQP